MTRTALAIEIEELLFDTRALRVAALCHALELDGSAADAAPVVAAHGGATVAMAVARLPVTAALDAVGRELMVRRADDAFHALIGEQPPSFDVDAAAAVRTLSLDHPIAVVTRASHADARVMLEMAGLDASVNIVRSLAGYDIDDYAAAWREALQRVHADRGVAVAPAPLLVSARAAGLPGILIGSPDGTTVASLASLSAVDASYIASLF